MTILTAENVSVAHGRGSAARRILDDVALTFHGGAVSLIMGPPGSGKTTLLSALGGLRQPEQGRVGLNGVDMYSRGDADSAASRRRFFGFVFQSCQLFPMLTTLENVRIPLDLRGDEYDAANARARRLLTIVGLAHRLAASPCELNPCELRRVAIARALALDPLVLFADEPTASLNTAGCWAVAAVLRRIASDLGKTVVIVSDDDRLAPFADRHFQIEHGRVRSNEMIEAS